MNMKTYLEIKRLEDLKDHPEEITKEDENNFENWISVILLFAAACLFVDNLIVRIFASCCLLLAVAMTRKTFWMFSYLKFKNYISIIGGTILVGVMFVGGFMAIRDFASAGEEIALFTRWAEQDCRIADFFDGNTLNAKKAWKAFRKLSEEDLRKIQKDKSPIQGYCVRGDFFYTTEAYALNNSFKGANIVKTRWMRFDRTKITKFTK